MNVDRLTRMAALLRKDAANPTGVKFDLDAWATSATQPTVDCGTTACAFGLACLSGEFKGDGLTYSTESYTGDDGHHLIGIIPVFGGAKEFNAVCDFFEIGWEDAHKLFSPDWYCGLTKGKESEELVAARIEAFIQTG